jgi:hypothetical protein
VRQEGLGKLKNPMTSEGLEPATFWLVAQCLNQLHYRVPPVIDIIIIIIIIIIKKCGFLCKIRYGVYIN